MPLLPSWCSGIDHLLQMVGHRPRARVHEPGGEYFDLAGITSDSEGEEQVPPLPGSGQGAAAAPGGSFAATFNVNALPAKNQKGKEKPTESTPIERARAFLRLNPADHNRNLTTVSQASERYIHST